MRFKLLNWGGIGVSRKFDDFHIASILCESIESDSTRIVADKQGLPYALVQKWEKKYSTIWVLRTLKWGWVNVWTSLSEVIENVREDISYCEYTKDTDNEGYVLIVYCNGHVARICVTLCGNLCIMHDVSNYLLNH